MALDLHSEETLLHHGGVFVERGLGHLVILICSPTTYWRQHRHSIRARSAPLSLSRPPVDKYVVGDAVPGVMNADEEQQQRRSSDAEQSLAGVGESRECRKREYHVRSRRQHA